ncbi:co-chaperone YbbN [Achromobacter sp. MYb9]|uniref:thioredoxin family protein n=1 Tax=Achromobacter sp. MYb9 TaxID=1827284 RepID=UPI0011B29974|nr:thioredoxin family protein [Achromobacter sp. MYb9]
MNMTVPSWVGKVEELDATAFNRLARSSNVPILLYIGAPWCPPCTTMGPAVEKAAEDFGGHVRVVKVNAATDSQLLNSLKVAAVPMIVLYGEYGRELGRYLGNLSAREISRWVRTKFSQEQQEAYALVS